MATVFLIWPAKGVHKVSFLLQNLQVEHDDREHGKAKHQGIAVHQQNADIHEIKAEERRVTAESINVGCEQLCFILVRNTRPPATLHAQNGQQEDRVAQHPNAKAAEPFACVKMTPAEDDGEKLRYGYTQRRNAHQ